MIQSFADYITFSLLNLTAETPMGDAINFFIYDVIKILLLIFTVVSTINFIRTFFEAKQIKESIGKLKWGLGNIIAALLVQ